MTKRLTNGCCTALPPAASRRAIHRSAARWWRNSVSRSSPGTTSLQAVRKQAHVSAAAAWSRGHSLGSSVCGDGGNNSWRGGRQQIQ